LINAYKCLEFFSADHPEMSQEPSLNMLEGIVRGSERSRGLVNLDIK
jgi:hypothetical protein